PDLIQLRLTCSILSLVAKQFVFDAVVYIEQTDHALMAKGAFASIAPVIRGIDFVTSPYEKLNSTALFDVIEPCPHLDSLSISTESLNRANEQQFSEMRLSLSPETIVESQYFAPRLLQFIERVFTRLSAMKLSVRTQDKPMLFHLLPFLSQIRELDISKNACVFDSHVFDWVIIHCPSLHTLLLNVSIPGSDSDRSPALPSCQKRSPFVHLLKRLRLKAENTSVLQLALLLTRLTSLFPSIEDLELEQTCDILSSNTLFYGVWDLDQSVHHEFLRAEKLSQLASARAFAHLVRVTLRTVYLAPVLQHILFSASQATLRDLDLDGCFSATPKPPASTTWQNYFYTSLGAQWTFLSSICITYDKYYPQSGACRRHHAHFQRPISYAYAKGHFSMDVLLDNLQNLIHLELNGVILGPNASNPGEQPDKSPRPLKTCKIINSYVNDSENMFVYLSTRCPGLAHLALDEVVLYHDQKGKKTEPHLNTSDLLLRQRMEGLRWYDYRWHRPDDVMFLSLPFTNLDTLEIGQLRWCKRGVPMHIVVVQSLPNTPQQPLDGHTCHVVSVRSSAPYGFHSHGQHVSGWMVDRRGPFDLRKVHPKGEWWSKRSKDNEKYSGKFNDQRIFAVVCQSAQRLKFKGRYVNLAQ
ncbi:hypothetical protein BC940DRAFT_358776, partial [Gongronella butleri]